MAAYEHALEAYTKPDLPQDWFRTQYNLGLALSLENNYSGAVQAFESALEVSPKSIEPLSALASILHDNLYEYDRAYEMEERILKLNPSADTRLDFTEASLTAAHYAGCIEESGKIDDASLPAPQIGVRDALRMACEFAIGHNSSATETGKILATKAAAMEKAGFSFRGTIHFLTASSDFARGRAYWVSLFGSIEKGDGAAMATALQQLGDMMQH